MGTDQSDMAASERTRLHGDIEFIRAEKRGAVRLLGEVRAERDRYREALHTIAADTHDQETAEGGRAWRVKLAHDTLASDEEGDR